DTIKNEKNASRKQYGKGQQSDAGGDKPRPSAKRHAHQRHALGAKVEGSRNEIERSKQLANAEDCYRNCPQRLSHSLARAGAGESTERGVCRPTRERRPVAHKECCD